jgi:hypothetical protein
MNWMTVPAADSTHIYIRWNQQPEAMPFSRVAWTGGECRVEKVSQKDQ